MWGARAKLTAWYGGLMAVMILVIFLGVAGVVWQRFDNEIQDALDDARRLLAEQESLVPASSADAQEEAFLELVQRLPADVFIIVTDAEGRVIANPRGVSLEEVDLGEEVENLLERARPDSGVHSVGGDRYKLVTVGVGAPAPTSEVPAGVFLHIGQSLAARESLVDSLFWATVGVGVLGLALAVVGGFIVAGRALRPINQALEEQRRFASDASHELRTPLSVIRMNAEILEMHRDDRVEEQMESVETIIEETDRVTRLVASLLTLARTDEGQLDLATETLELGELVAETVDDLEPLGAVRGVKVEAFVERVMVSADRQRLKQLIAILVDNGVKYTPESGTVTVLVRQTGTEAFIRVRDTGPGIPAEDRERVFDRFYRVDKARSREAGGSGLGLSIARWIAEIHGGSIRAELAPSGGAEIVVRLPRE